MRYVITVLAAATAVALAGCDRPATTSSTTVVKEPIVQKEKETVIREPNSTTIVQAPAQPMPQTSTTTIVQQPPANTTGDTSKPETIERSRSTTTTRVDTPYGTASRTETESTKTTR